MHKTLLRCLVVGATLTATTAVPVATHAPTAGAAAGVIGPLSVQGNQIVDGNGNPLTLRGIHRDLPQRVGYGTTFPLVTGQEIDAMKAWGANVVRVPVSSALWLPDCPQYYDPNYKTNIEALVSKVTSDGMVAIVDLHEITGADCSAPSRRAVPNASSARFWSDAAPVFASNNLVMFELFNEPHPADEVTWQTGQQRLYDAVEATGAPNLVIIDADKAATDPSAITDGHAVNDTNHNIAYAVHPYTCPDPSNTLCMQNPLKHLANATTLNKFVAVATNYPIVATEFGWPNPPDNGADFYRNTYLYLDSQRPAWGSIAFGWNGTLTGGFHMLASLAPNYDPNQTGTAVKTELSGQP